MKYEMVREIFNKCSQNQMRDVFIENVETDNPAEYIKNLLAGKEVNIEENTFSDGTIIFDVDIAGLRQRFSFTKD